MQLRPRAVHCAPPVQQLLYRLVSRDYDRLELVLGFRSGYLVQVTKDREGWWAWRQVFGAAAAGGAGAVEEREEEGIH
jgi:hypothetical protein